MVGHFFEPDEKFCLIFHNEFYDKLRELPEFNKRYDDDEDEDLIYDDMPHARKWANEFEDGIKKYEFSDNQIQRYTDVDRETMWYAINDAIDKIKENAEQGHRTLLLCFYAGHAGTEGGTTWALVNSNQRGYEDGGNLYGLEVYLNECAK